jgi:transcription-repair coupling factor (superfamily II helicase)
LLFDFTTYVNLNSRGKKRLKTIVEFSELGSGFEIAMRDLDIRVVATYLGVSRVALYLRGYDAFQRVLEEAIQELRR